MLSPYSQGKLTGNIKDIMKKKFYCIDGNAYVHRAYHALPMMTDNSGQPTNAVYGFIKMLNRIIKEKKPDYLVVCFDSPKPTVRHRAYKAYKATRKPTDADLKSQFPLVHEVVKSMDVGLIAIDGYEADDIIATLCSKAMSEGIDSVIVTGDKDAFQLVNDSVTVFNEQKRVLYDSKKVFEKTGVKPGQFIDLQALMGDSADNIPGVAGIGPKTAVPLILQYGGLDCIYSNLPSIKENVRKKLEGHRDDAYLSKKLATLIKDLPIKSMIVDYKLKQPDKNKLLSVYKKLGFKSLLYSLAAEPEAPVIEYPESGPGAGEIKDRGGVEYRALTAKKDIEKFIGKLSKEEILSIGVLADSQTPMKANISGIALALKEEGGCCIPLGRDREAVLKQLKPVLEDGSIRKCGHDLKRSIVLLSRQGIKLAGVCFDSMVASYVLDPSGKHGIEEVALTQLDYKLPSPGEPGGQLDFGELAGSKTYGSACSECSIVLRLMETMMGQLREKGMEELFKDVELPLVSVLAEMEQEGILIDGDYLGELSREFAGDIMKLEKEIFRIAGQEFNLNSPKQLSFILFEKLKLPVIERTKTGYSTAESVLAQLSSSHELPGLMIRYRELQKLKSTYVDTLPQLINPDTGRVHSSFNQAVTATGRLSSSEPNLQNIPVRSELGIRIRGAFIPDKGCVIISADYSQIDLRALAHISGDKNLMDSFMNNQDVHTRTASEIFNVEQEAVTKDMRRLAKVVNFGLCYGMGAHTLAKDVNIPVKTAKEYIETYFKKYEGVREYIDNTIKQAGIDGYVSTVLKRRRYLPEINSRNRRLKNNAEKMAINTPIQGTSSDIIKVAMINISRRLKAEKLESRMIVQIHDELLFEVPVKEQERVSALVRMEMENSIKLKVPLVVDVKAGKSWRDLKE